MSKEKSASRVLDIAVVILCLSGFGASLYFFQNDLLKTLRSMSIQSAGYVTIKHNTVQRRMADRVVWDRLNAQSPVYPGDLIRIARHSGAMLNIDNNYVELGENSLIRIQKNSDASQIDFYLGSIYITSEQDSGSIVLSIAEQKIESAPGAVFYASYDNEGMILQVSEGIVQMTQDGFIQSIPAGNVIIKDIEGNERLEPMALVSYPRPNARYLKSSAQSEPVYFNWNRINLDPQEGLRLEIAEDYSFSKVAYIIEDLDSTAAVPVGNGVKYWRLSAQDAVLSTGRMTVTEAVPPLLLNPAQDAVFNFRTTWPKIYFRWSESEDVMFYILQISQSQDFSDSITSQVQGTSYIGPELGPGRWYWRVQPVYSHVYESGYSEASAIYSKTSGFNISKSDELQMPVLVMPASDSMVNIGIDRTDISFSWSSYTNAVSYTIQISSDPNLRNPAVIDTVRNNFYVYGKEKNILSAGLYYWSVFYTDDEGNTSPLPPAKHFTAVERAVNIRLIFPPDNYSIEEDHIQNTRFSWRTNILHEKRFQVSAFPDFSDKVIDEPASDDFFQGISIPPGDWYWRISARYDAMSPVYYASSRSFSLVRSPPPPKPEPIPEPIPVPVQIVQLIPPPQRVVPEPVQEPQPAPEPVRIPEPVQEPAPQPVKEPEPVLIAELPVPVRIPEPVREPEPVPEPVQEPDPEPEPSRLMLRSPLQNAVIPGLTAITQPTVFSWETSDVVRNSRFLLSRRSNLSQSEVEILNPGRSVTVNSLEEGLWYWIFEAFTPEGLPFLSEGPRQLQVQPIPLLPAPQNIQPVRGFRIGAEELRRQRDINFSWSAADGANRYVLTISKDTGSGLQQIFQTEPQSALNYSFSNLELLEHNATYIWKVEAFFYNSNGVIIQRSLPGESHFSLNVPRPGRVQIDDLGILYGF
ncbi:MAG: hypothetical protein FWC03_05350 [Treponema sp.]|nr:hypothetical protein [Treponema sp.]